MKNTLAALLAATLAGACPAMDPHDHENPHHHHGPDHDHPAAEQPAPHAGHSARSAHAGHDHEAATSYGPVGVMGDHTHPKDGWMVSYRRMSMDMEGNRIGSTRVSDAAVLNRHMITPLSMEMEMDMFGVMYAPSDRLTWMLMIPRVELEMEHRNRMNRLFTTRSEGVGDLTLSALIADEHRAGFRSHFQVGLEAPTGEVNVFDATPMGPNTLLPYPMRLGGGTYAAILGYTQVRDVRGGNAGLQFRATMPFGRNDEGYRVGDELLVTGWRQWQLGDEGAVSARLAWSSWDDIDGADPRLRAGMVPTANPNLRAGDRLDLGLGMNWTVGKGHRLSLEYLVPVRQDLDGPQLEVDRTWIFGWSVRF